jgi:hypothetical protein
MSEPVRLALGIHAHQAQAGGDTWVDTQVQVWQGQKYLTTYSLIEFSTIILPEAAPLDTIENYAATVARVMARALDEVQYKAIADKTLHHIRDLGEMPDE